MNLEFIAVDDGVLLMRLTDGNAQIHHQERITVKELGEKLDAAIDGWIAAHPPKDEPAPEDTGSAAADAITDEPEAKASDSGAATAGPVLEPAPSSDIITPAAPTAVVEAPAVIVPPVDTTEAAS